MEKNRWNYAVLFGAVTYLIHFLKRSPLPSEGILLTYLAAVLPLLAGGIGLLRFNKSLFTWERFLKVTAGSLVIGFLSLSAAYYSSLVLNDSMVHDPELKVWCCRAALELFRVTVPAVLFLGVLDYAFSRRLFPGKRTLFLLAVFAVCTVLASFLTAICMPRTIPSELVGDFGRRAGGSFMWILEELTPLLFPGLVFSLCAAVDRQLKPDIPPEKIPE